MIVLLHIIGTSLHAGFNSSEDLSPDSLYAASRPQILRLLTSTSIQAIETNLLAVLSSDEEIKIWKAVVVHRLRVHRSVVAVRCLHLFFISSFVIALTCYGRSCFRPASALSSVPHRGTLEAQRRPMVTDISFEEIIRATYSGDDIGISGIQDNKENLTFPSFIVDS
ncbi:hypothetical protein F2Q69_00043954 [Brassica cretica]|uniref:Uncharacterized protein n=1 Tax=Brassica cretica TaxID=69181 RepID=A0A8S9NJL4_BRACR|nr:hypothetical protein F2Q69_00043954 [Brassica cretica]